MALAGLGGFIAVLSKFQTLMVRHYEKNKIEVFLPENFQLNWHFFGQDDILLKLFTFWRKLQKQTTFYLFLILKKTYRFMLKFPEYNNHCYFYYWWNFIQKYFIFDFLIMSYYKPDISIKHANGRNSLGLLSELWALLMDRIWPEIEDITW